MPFLQFHDIPLWIAHIYEREPAGAGNIQRYKLAIVAPAPNQYFLALSFHIRHLKRDMGETGARELRSKGRIVWLVLENFQGWSLCAVAR